MINTKTAVFVRFVARHGYVQHVIDRNLVSILAHLQSSVGAYPKSLHSLNMKNGRSETPLT